MLLAGTGALLSAAQKPSMVGRTAVVNDTTLAYDRSGSGPLVVFISGGATLDRRMWDEQVAALSSRYTVLRYDIRGIGDSSRPEAPFSHSEDLYALLRSVANTPAYVVGLSFGAGIAIDLALDHPRTVRGLVLVAPGLSSDKDANLQAAQAAGESVRKNGLHSVVDAIVANESFLATASDDVRERVKTLYLDNAEVFESNFALVRLWRPTVPPADERLTSIRVPTLVLVGAADAVQVRATADTLASRIEGAEKIVLPDAGHLAHFDAPEQFNESLLDFLSTSR